MTGPHPKRVEWFLRGARTLRAVARERGVDGFPVEGEWYLCPLCPDAYSIDELGTGGMLTEEHVPPKGLGGRKVVLTCKRCNNAQGTALDAQAVMERKFLQFFSGQGRRSERAAVTVGGVTANMDVDLRAGVFMVGLPNENEPTALTRFEQQLRSMSDESTTDVGFSVTPRMRYHVERANLSWIRTAYLAAFAVFGWRYILQTSLQPIRDQLQNPDVVALPRLHAFDPEADPERFEVCLVK